MSGKVKVTLVKSLIGRREKHILTVHSLGLRKIGDAKVFEENPQLAGKLFAVKHLIRVDKAD
jgi:large subunit ribosomal protein L30